MKKKIIVITCGVLLSTVLLFGAIPIAAADGPSTTSPPATQTVGKGQLLVRILSVPTQAQLEALLTKAETNGKITSAQAIKIENFWTAHHKQFAWNFTLRRLLQAQNETNVKTYLDKAVANGKITQDQENKVIAIWEIIHTPAPTTTSIAP